nr:MAG TPA: hypothetical protein [Caudoviricetes sp.]
MFFVLLIRLANRWDFRWFDSTLVNFPTSI